MGRRGAGGLWITSLFLSQWLHMATFMVDSLLLVSVTMMLYLYFFALCQWLSQWLSNGNLYISTTYLKFLWQCLPIGNPFLQLPYDWQSSIVITVYSSHCDLDTTMRLSVLTVKYVSAATDFQQVFRTDKGLNTNNETNMHRWKHPQRTITKLARYHSESKSRQSELELPPKPSTSHQQQCLPNNFGHAYDPSKQNNHTINIQTHWLHIHSSFQEPTSSASQALIIGNYHSLIIIIRWIIWFRFRFLMMYPSCYSFGSSRPQLGPMFAPWTLVSGLSRIDIDHGVAR